MEASRVQQILTVVALCTMCVDFLERHMSFTSMWLIKHVSGVELASDLKEDLLKQGSREDWWAHVCSRSRGLHKACCTTPGPMWRVSGQGVDWNEHSGQVLFGEIHNCMNIINLNVYGRNIASVGLYLPSCWALANLCPKPIPNMLTVGEIVLHYSINLFENYLR